MGVVLGALSRAVPELVPADTHRTSFHNMIGGIRSRGEYVHYEWGSGGNGAFADGDGASAMGAVDWAAFTRFNLPRCWNVTFLFGSRVLRWRRTAAAEVGSGAVSR